MLVASNFIILAIATLLSRISLRARQLRLTSWFIPQRNIELKGALLLRKTFHLFSKLLILIFTITILSIFLLKNQTFMFDCQSESLETE